MIKITYENHEEFEVESLFDAINNIIEMVVDEHDQVAEIEDTVTGKHYSCRWSLSLIPDMPPLPPLKPPKGKKIHKAA